jgi:hypothetical protein
MAAIAGVQCVPTPLIPTGFGSGVRPEPQGEDGKVLIRNAEVVCLQWVERAEVLIAVSDDGDELSYVSLALKPAFYVKVRYKYVGKMKSVPYPFDD